MKQKAEVILQKNYFYFCQNMRLFEDFCDFTYIRKQSQGMFWFN